MRASLGSTSTRTFALWPAVVAVEQALARRPVRARYLPLLAWGFLQYRLSGRYRTRLGGGGPGMGQPPERLVTSGIYRFSRNPMYLGHLIFLSGLALATRSPLAKLLLVAHLPWFDQRVRADEEGLKARFADDYARYGAQTPRWLGLPRRLPTPDRDLGPSAEHYDGSEETAAGR